ncbi:MAG: MMPL family transporter [SAR324 cluster bacterium]|nr:MMPL family transporter [SAR324 cluster bacterium]
MVQKLLIDFAIKRAKLVMVLSGFITLFFLAAFPSLTTDTDPVKMLPQDNPAIVLYGQMKKEFDVHDMVVLGINKPDGSSLFTVDGLTKIHKITEEILEIKDRPPEPSWMLDLLHSVQFLKEKEQGGGEVRDIMVTADVMSISTVDDIVRNAAGELKVAPLMPKPPPSDVRAKQILTAINENPILRGKLASEDGSLVGIFIPLQEGMKDRSYFLGEEMKRIASKYLIDGEDYYLAGLPIAENTFGNEMFVQMGVYAPAAGLVIFLLLFYFFRSIKLIIAPMLLAMMAVIWAMGALIYSGNTIHIMSSMIPIFLMPIAVLNSIHIMSKLHQNYHQYGTREEAVRAVMKELFNPMLYTSITTIVGFVSLTSTGIPPVMVFGITVGFGVFLAWALSMIFIPAYTMLMDEETLEKFGQLASGQQSWIMEITVGFKTISAKMPVVVIVAAVVLLLISVIGIQKIIVNDNPVRWFKEGHVLREADQVMNGKLAGTYMANLVFELPLPAEMAAGLLNTPSNAEENAFGDEEGVFSEKIEQAPLADIKNGEMVQYMEKIQQYLLSLRNEEEQVLVGGVTSLVDILKKVGKTALNDATLPKNREQVAQYMFLFESGDLKKGKDMWKFITRDGRKAQMWIQLKNGDNNQMSYLNTKLSGFMAQQGNEPPVVTYPNGESTQLKVQWSGLTYINGVWQDEMVNGMRSALIGSFGIVFLMMVFLFRSLLWGIISMLPLSLTIMAIYGFIGYIGKYYDMPIAVLSSLTLGLSVDFAIHYIESLRSVYRKLQNFQKTYEEISSGTAQAIWRNVLVISIGFMPLFFAGLVPYVTVGSFFFAIMLVSGVTTLILLPSIVTVGKRWLLKTPKQKTSGDSSSQEPSNLDSSHSLRISVAK